MGFAVASQLRSVLLHCLAATSTVACGGGEAGNTSRGASRPGIEGTLETEAGEPLRHKEVLACMATTCLFGETDSEARFMFSIEPPAEVALKTHEDLSRSPRLAAALRPVRLEQDTLLDLEVVRVPALPEGVPFGPVASDPQTLLAGDGLELTLARGDLEPALGDILVDLAARRVPVADIPALPGLEAPVVAVYALHPFAASSQSPIAVRAPSNLPAGTAVSFRTISAIDGTISPPVPGVSDGVSVTTESGAGISELTWLVISGAS